MGRTWVGFQPAAKHVAGSMISEQDAFAVGLDDPALMHLLTTADGLAGWIAHTTAFTDRRGGDIDFTHPDGGFTGTFSLIDIPRRVVLLTDRHGEIDLRIDVRARPTQLSVTIRCLVPEGEDIDAARTRAREIITALRGCAANGREAG